jgi:hypothetical protein
VALAITAIIIFGSLILVIVPLQSTWIYVELRTAAVKFTIPTEEDLADGLGLSWIEAAPLTSATAFEADGFAREAVAPDTSMGIALRDSAWTAGGLTLSRLSLPARSHLALRAAPTPGQWVMSLECDSPCDNRGLQLERSGKHSLRMSPADSATKVQTLSPSRAVLAHLGTRHVTLEFAVPPGEQKGLIDHLRVTKVSFDATEERGDGPGFVSRSLSGLFGGTIYFPAFTNRSFSLHPRQWLHTEFEDGWIEQLRFRGDTIVLTLSGKASKVRIGPSDEDTNLMPTLLEYLYARYALQLWVTTILVGIPAAIGALKWLFQG